MAIDPVDEPVARALNQARREGKARRQQRKSSIHGSIHKRRAEWFQGRSAWPRREAPTGLLRSARAVDRRMQPAALSAEWHPVGPSNIGGRMTSVVAHPTIRGRLWAGAAGGGVWRSDDTGAHWRPLWHDQETLNIGSLAIDPNEPRKIFCGTGEANLSADSYAGAGLYRSLTSGGSWRLIAAAEKAGIPSRIGALAVDPFDSQHLVLGGISFAYGDSAAGAPGGTYTSTDGGFTWRREDFLSSHNYWCHSVTFDPALQGRIFVTVTENGNGSGIWRSDDGGATWHRLATGLPPGHHTHRVSLALCPADPSRLYALIADARYPSFGRVLGVYRSDDGGESWRPIDGGHFWAERQMSYNNSIAVHPQDPDLVICGGVDLHRSQDGGLTWLKVTDWRADRGAAGYAHADQHAILFSPSEADVVYALNDGGMDVSSDRGRSWANRSDGLAVTMFYDLAQAASDARLFGGGAQDNGSVLTFDGQSSHFEEVSGGDGGWLVIDRLDAGHFFASWQYMGLVRFRLSDLNPTVTEVSPNVPQAERDRVWMAYVALSLADPRTLLTASSRLWRSDDDGDTWQPISQSLDGSVVRAIEIAEADSNRIYVGTENGGLFRSTDGGANWSGDLAGAELPHRTITRIAAAAADAERVYAVVANYGHDHVYRSDDGGLSWRALDDGQLPDAPLHAVVLPRNRPQTVLVAGDAGVFRLDESTGSWASLTGNLPTTLMIDLVHHEADDTLTVATYGRSLWRLRF